MRSSKEFVPMNGSCIDSDGWRGYVGLHGFRSENRRSGPRPYNDHNFRGRKGGGNRVTDRADHLAGMETHCRLVFKCPVDLSAARLY